MSAQGNQYQSDRVGPPGSTLQDALTARGMTEEELARRVGRSVGHVARLVAGIAVHSPMLAIRLERALGIPARLWMSRRAHYDALLSTAADGGSTEAP
jgi:HTH-type transcriptional regulator/antitoxin HigA